MAKKHLVFILHGMGEYEEGWSKDTQTILRDSYQSFESLNSLLPFDDHFELIELNYNDIFNQLRMQWKENADKVLTQFGAQTSSSRSAKKVLNELSKSGRATFLRTHLLDVALYRFVATVADAVQTRVAVEITNRIEANPHSSWSIIGHSLGTAVAHDTLHRMFSPDAENTPFPMGSYGASVVAMVANVSRLLELSDTFGPDWDAYKSVVRPSPDAASGCCKHYVNAWNYWDPFVWPSKFSPANTWPDPATHSTHYKSIKLTEIEDKDVHALEHYLQNPKVHVELFRRLTAPGMIEDHEAHEAIRSYQEGLPLGLAESRIKELKKLTMSEHEGNWATVFSNFAKYL